MGAKEAFYGGTRDPNALVKRILFKINRTYKVTDHLAQPRTITYKSKKNISKEIENFAHCVKIMYNRDDEVYLGFIQLKDYMKLSKVADILGAGPEAGQLNRSPVERKHMNNTDCAIEACEVRGRTEDIFSGIPLPVCEADVGSTVEARRDGQWKPATLRAYSGDGVTVRYYDDVEADIPSDIDSVRKGALSIKEGIKEGKSEQGETKWEAYQDWFEACRLSSEYKKDKHDEAQWVPIHEYVPKASDQTTKRCKECSKCGGEGTVPCEKNECMHTRLLGSHPCPKGECKKACPACQSKSQYFPYDDEPCFNLVSGIMQALEDIWQKNSIRTLQGALEEEKRENCRNRAMVQDLYHLLVKKDILHAPDKASTDSEESVKLHRTMSRAEGELPTEQQSRQGEASPVGASIQS